MQQIDNPYVLALLIAAALSVTFAGIAWRRRGSPGAIPLVFLAVAVAAWQLGYAFELANDDRSTKILWAKIQYFSIVTITTSWLAVTLQYTGRGNWLTHRNLAFLAVIPLVTVILVWTNGVHNLIWTDINSEVHGSLVVLELVHGAWFWLFAAYSYLLLIAGIVFLAVALLHSFRLYWEQGLALFIAALVPWATNWAYTVGLTPVPNLDLTPLAFFVSVIAIAWALLRVRLLDITPVAREAVFDNISDGVLVLDALNRVVDINSAARAILGEPAASAIGRSVKEVWPDGPDLTQSSAGVAADHLEITQDRDHEQRTYDVTASPLFDGQEHLAGQLILLHDTTDRRQAQEALRQSEERLRAVLDNTPVILFALDSEGVFTLSEGNGLEALGRKPGQVVGQSIFDVYKDVPPILDNIRRALAGEPRSYVVEVEGVTFDARYRPLWDTNGQVTGVVGVVHDITQRKREEENLRETSRLISVGELAAGVAHEINNPLTAVVGFSELVMKESLPPSAEERMKRIRFQAERASRIVKNLLSFARRVEPERRYVDVASILARSLELKSYDLKISNISVETPWSEELPLTMVDDHQLIQVMVNILNNAEQAMIEAHGKGKLIIDAKESEDHIRITVSDDGPGILPEHLPKIFDPFFTTKEVGTGTGLGLSTCYGIVRQHGGKIWAESIPERGATFHIELPIVSHLKENDGKSQTTYQPNGTTKHILVVDDEPDIRNLLADALSSERYTVAMAEGGKQAWNMLQRGSYDCILLDLKMPEMSGQELYRLIMDSDLDLAKKVVFITGDSLSPDTRSFIADAGNVCLNKPFSLLEFRRTISSL